MSNQQVCLPTLTFSVCFLINFFACVGPMKCGGPCLAEDVEYALIRLREEVTHPKSNWHSNFEVKRPRSRSLGGGNVKIILGAYLREKRIDSRQTKTSMTPFHAACFVRYDVAAKMRAFRDMCDDIRSGNTLRHTRGVNTHTCRHVTVSVCRLLKQHIAASR